MIRRIEEDQNIINTLKGELSQYAEKQARNINGYREESNKNMGELTERIRSLDESVRQKEDLVKTTRSSFDKEKAILHQKIEFLELQLSEAKNQNNEIKRAYEQALQYFDGNNQSGGDAAIQLEELKESHRAAMKHLEVEFDTTRKKMNSQIQSLTDRNNELELSFKLKVSEMNKEIENLREEFDQSEQQRRYLADQNKVLEDQKTKLFKEADERYSLRIRSLEAELEEQNAKLERDIHDINVKNEENLAQLRNFYEIEKERLERRIIEEKERAEKRYSNLMEEYEAKLKEEQNLHEEELDTIKDELRELEIHNASLTQQYEHELMLRQQSIDTLEKYLKETKETLATIQLSSSASLDNHLANFANERAQLITRIENFAQEVSKRDREIFSLTQFKDQIETASIKKEAALEKARNELIEERNALNQKLEDWRNKHQGLNDEYLEKKVELNRELALKQQQVSLCLS